MLIEEHSLDKFGTLSKQLIHQWKEIEPKFIDYFMKNYQHRPG